MEFAKHWLSLQVDLGTFHSRRAVYGFAVKMTFRAVILASLINLAVLPLCYLLGLLPMPLADAMLVSVAFCWLFGGAVSGALALVTGNVIRELSLSRTRYARRSRTDMLSGLMNRRAFTEMLRRVEADASLAILDLDRFKSINDCHGHAAGDMVIKSVAAIIRDVFPRPSVCARLGGEEFGVIVVGASPAERLALVEDVRMRVERDVLTCGGASVSATISAGIAEFRPGRRTESVYTAADRALYLAKAGGRNRIVHDEQSFDVFGWSEPPTREDSEAFVKPPEALTA